MRTVNIHEAKTHLSRLVEEAAKGNVFIIAKAGRPMVKVTPLVENEDSTQQKIGFMTGEISVPEDFDSMGADTIVQIFDRILIAQARTEGMKLVTADGSIAAYGESVLPV